MPTKKPRVQTILEIDTYEKFKYVCDKEMRTESQMASYIITNFITEYEQNHGNISIKNVNLVDNRGSINNINM